MKNLLLLLFFIPFWTLAQRDTIEISQFKSSQIIFNDEIQLVEPGTGDLQVKYKNIDNILILQSEVPAADFISTNLFIKTKANIYNIIVKYKENPRTSTYLESYFKPTVNIGGETLPLELGKNKKEGSSKIISPISKIDNFTGVKNSDKFIIQNLFARNEMFKPSRQYQTGVWFKFFAHYILNGKYYFKFELENTTDLDYHLDHIFYSVKNRRKRNASDTQREVTPIRFVNEADRVGSRTKRFLIYEFEAFSINPDEEFIVEVKEAKGARNFTIGIPYYIMNKPLKL